MFFKKYKWIISNGKGWYSNKKCYDYIRLKIEISEKPLKKRIFYEVLETIYDHSVVFISGRAVKICAPVSGTGKVLVWRFSPVSEDVLPSGAGVGSSSGAAVASGAGVISGAGVASAVAEDVFLLPPEQAVMVSSIAAQQTAHSKRMQVFIFMFLSKMGYGTRHRREKFLVLIKCTTFAGFMQENPARALRN